MLTINTIGYSPKTGQPVFQDKVNYKSEGKEYIFDIVIHWQSDSFLLEGKLLSAPHSECNRCLEPIKEIRELSFADLYLRNPEDLSKYEEDFLGNIFFLEDGIINLTDSLNAALIEYKAEKNLCDQDCKGLCQICGKNLNLGDCQCEHDNLDPRLEILKNFKF